MRDRRDIEEKILLEREQQAFSFDNLLHHFRSLIPYLPLPTNILR